jgi:anti-sigma regulatory factor (Ser/Thr protein kinase)
MGPLLTTGTPPDAIRVIDEASVSVVREAVRACAAQAGLNRDRAESLVNAASELAHNQLAHAHAGEVVVRPVSRSGTAGVEVLASDLGQGIADPTAALRGEGRSAGPGRRGLGVGLSAAYRLADEIDFDVRWGEGTVVAARKYAAPIPRREVAIVGRPCAGERVIGDDALWLRDDLGLLCAVVDGLGHGPPAKTAAVEAMATVGRSPARAAVDLLDACGAALGGTRGAVMSVVRVDEVARDLVHAGVGNVTSHLYQGKSTERFLASPGVLGAPGPRARVQERRVPLDARNLLVMFTDGLSSRLDAAGDPYLLREPPLVIAHRLLLAHGREHDDALVLVAAF